MMGLLKVTGRIARFKKEPLIEFYGILLQSDSSPFKIALRNLELLERQSAKEDEDGEEGLMVRCLEGAAYFSIQATCYEEILMSLVDNSDQVDQCIQQFDQSRELQHDLVWEQAYTHGSYVMRNGQCPGCDQCENHKDVDELIPRYQEKDLIFFLELYLGMQAVYLAMDDLLTRFIQEDNSRVKMLTRKRILEFRSYVYENTERRFRKMIPQDS